MDVSRVNDRIRDKCAEKKSKRNREILDQKYAGLDSGDPSVILATISKFARAFQLVNFQETAANSKLLLVIGNVLVSDCDISLKEAPLACLMAILSQTEGDKTFIDKCGVIHWLVPLSRTDNVVVHATVLQIIDLVLKHSRAVCCTVYTEIGISMFTEPIRNGVSLLPALSCLRRIILSVGDIHDSGLEIMGALKVVLEHNVEDALLLVFRILSELFEKCTSFHMIADELDITNYLPVHLSSPIRDVVLASLACYFPILRSGKSDAKLDVPRVLELMSCPDEKIRIVAVKVIDCFIRAKPDSIPLMMSCHLGDLMFGLLSDSSFKVKMLCIRMVNVIVTHGDDVSRAVFCHPFIIDELINVLSESKMAVCVLTTLDKIFESGGATVIEYFISKEGNALIEDLAESLDEDVAHVAGCLHTAYFQ